MTTDLTEARKLADVYASANADSGILARSHKELEAECERLQSALASLADTVAAAHRNTNLPNPDIGLSTDLREYVWQLSYTANTQRLRAETAEAQRDSLVLEFCPDEMTPEQRKNWEAHQQPAKLDKAEAQLRAPVASEVETMASLLERTVPYEGASEIDLNRAAAMLRQLERAPGKTGPSNGSGPL